LRERILADQITAKYGRTQILEWYLNSADYGNEAFGVDAAAQLYFGKSADELNPIESAELAATSQTPSLNPFDAQELDLQRAQQTIQLMKTLGVISSDDAPQPWPRTRHSFPTLPLQERRMMGISPRPLSTW
jgi:membrane peptidoglycan carboxypeptidase